MSPRPGARVLTDPIGAGRAQEGSWPNVLATGLGGPTAKLNVSQGCLTRLPAAAGAVERKGRSRPGVPRLGPVSQVGQPAAAVAPRLMISRISMSGVARKRWRRQRAGRSSLRGPRLSGLPSHDAAIREDNQRDRHRPELSNEQLIGAGEIARPHLAIEPDGLIKRSLIDGNSHASPKPHGANSAPRPLSVRLPCCRSGGSTGPLLCSMSSLPLSAALNRHPLL